MASLPLPQRQVVGEHFADVSVEADMTASKHRQVLNELGFNEALIEERKKDRRERADWVAVVLNNLQFTKEASRHSLWLLTPPEVGITEAKDLTGVSQPERKDIFTLSFFDAAAEEGFSPCPPDALSAVAALFRERHIKRLYLGHKPVRDSAAGETLLHFSRRPNGLWLSDLRWHQNIQHLLSCETPWLFCRAD